METHSTMEIVRELIGGGDSLHMVVDVVWSEVCPGCAKDIGVGDVVVFVADHWRHEDCASPCEKALAMPRRRSGDHQSMKVLALYETRGITIAHTQPATGSVSSHRREDHPPALHFSAMKP